MSNDKNSTSLIIAVILLPTTVSLCSRYLNMHGDIVSGLVSLGAPKQQTAHVDSLKTSEDKQPRAFLGLTIFRLMLKITKVLH